MVADTHPVVRRGIRVALEAEPDLAIVGEAASRAEVLDLVEGLQPDVLVLNRQLQGADALEIAREAIQQYPSMRILILSLCADESDVRHAFRSGAVGYLWKGADPAEFIEAIRRVAAGRRYLSPLLAQHAIEAYARETHRPVPDLYETLTRREREVLHLVAEGYTNLEIAAKLGVSCRTSESHRTHLMRKLGLKNLSDLVRFAIRRGLLPE